MHLVRGTKGREDEAKESAPTVYMSLVGLLAEDAEKGSLEDKEGMEKFLRTLAWKLGEAASLRKNLSYMGFVLMTKLEALGATFGARLKSRAVQAERVVVEEAGVATHKWYVRIGKDRGNALYAQWAREKVGPEMAGTPGDEKAGGLHRGVPWAGLAGGEVAAVVGLGRHAYAACLHHRGAQGAGKEERHGP